MKKKLGIEDHILFAFLGLANFVVSTALFKLFELQWSAPLSDQFIEFILCLVLMYVLNLWFLHDLLRN